MLQALSMIRSGSTSSIPLGGAGCGLIAMSEASLLSVHGISVFHSMVERRLHTISDIWRAYLVLMRQGETSLVPGAIRGTRMWSWILRSSIPRRGDRDSHGCGPEDRLASARLFI